MHVKNRTATDQSGISKTTFNLTEVEIRRNLPQASSPVRGITCLKEDDSQDRLSKMIEVWISDLTAQSMEFAKSLRWHLPEHRKAVLLGKIKDILICRADKDAHARELAHIPAHIIEAKKKSDVEDKMLLAKMIVDCVLRSLLAMVDSGLEDSHNATDEAERGAAPTDAQVAPIIEFNPKLGKQDIAIDREAIKDCPRCVINVLSFIASLDVNDTNRTLMVNRRSHPKVQEYLTAVIEGGWISCPSKSERSGGYLYTFKAALRDAMVVQ